MKLLFDQNLSHRLLSASVDQIHFKLRNAADRIQTLDSDLDVEVVEVW
jgi:hypothetical protein